MVRGRARYLDDIQRPGMAYAAFVRSHHAHAAITEIRAPDEAPGLLAVITARELRGRVRPFQLDAPAGAELADQPHPILAEGEARYVGQPVAAVIASSRALAKDATELVEVDYEPREAVLDPDASGVDLMRWSHTGGDVSGAFAAASRIVRGRYALPRLVAAPIEPRGALVEHDPGLERVTVWCSMQDPHRPLAQLSHILGFDEERLNVIVPDVGGAFGSKGVIPAEVAVAAVAAIDLGRPVKWVEERTENFLAAYQGRGIEGELALALFDAAPAGGATAPRLRGTGIALYVEPAAGQWESATVSLEPDGRVLIASSASPHGQGHETTFSQIAADRLGLGVDKIVLRF